MSWNSRVAWTEGLFLQPQHLQQQDRPWQSALEARTRPQLAYSWGFVDMEVDRAALELGKIQLLSGHGIFGDGTPFDFPQEDPPPPAYDTRAVNFLTRGSKLSCPPAPRGGIGAPAGHLSGAIAHDQRQG